MNLSKTKGKNKRNGLLEKLDFWGLDTPKGDALEEREKEIEDREPEIKEEGERQDKEDEKKIKKLEIKIPMAEVKNTRNNTPDVFDAWEFWKKFNE